MQKTLRPDLFAVNSNPDLSFLDVGLGQNKVIIADHFYLYPDDILQAALELPFTDRFEIVGNFPGVRASLNVSTQPLVDHLSQIWGCSLSPFFSPQPVVFQGIKMQDFRLNVGQRQPHIDQDVTAMVYLNPEGFCKGGTGLYRHRPTELERVPIMPDATIRELADQLELSDEFLASPEGYENFQNSMIFNPLFACRENHAGTIGVVLALNTQNDTNATLRILLSASFGRSSRTRSGSTSRCWSSRWSIRSSTFPRSLWRTN